MDSGKLIQLLRQRKGYVSGEEISERLAVSRTTVWKHIHHLQTIGYGIDATPHCGYKLNFIPDQLLPDEIQWGLTTQKFGRKLFCYEKITSTNDRAMALASDGIPEGTMVAAEFQTKGRGRRERTWISKSGKNLLFSLVFRPPWIAEQGAMMTLLIATAVAQAIEKYCAIQVTIKWPNDILYQGKKLAGILTEMQAQADKISFLVAGIGINVNDVPEKDLRMPATSLAAIVGKPLKRLPLLRDVLWEVETLYADALKLGLEIIKEKWQTYFCLKSKYVCVKQPHGEELVGEVIGVSDIGALCLLLDTGQVKNITSGEIVETQNSKGFKGR